MDYTSDWWLMNEFVVKDAATHTYWFDDDRGEGRKPQKNEYVYFIDRKGVLFYIGHTRNPGHRFSDQQHHAVVQFTSAETQWRHHRVMVYGNSCKASLVPLKNVGEIIGFEVPTLEVAETLFIDLCSGGMNTELVNKKLSDQMYIEEKQPCIKHINL